METIEIFCEKHAITPETLISVYKDKLADTLDMFQYQGAILMSNERKEQIHKHGYTADYQKEHPEWYDEGQLLEAATKLLEPDDMKISTVCPKNWNMDYWDYVTSKSHQDRVIIAGALLMAYYDYKFV